MPRSTTAPAQSAAVADSSTSPNRSPRARPLPEPEWAPETVPREQRVDFFPERPVPRVCLAYPKAKRHFGR